MSDKNRRRSLGGGREARRELRRSQAQNIINISHIPVSVPAIILKVAYAKTPQAPT